MERYEGPRIGKREASELFGIEEVCFLEEFPLKIEKIMSRNTVNCLLIDQERVGLAERDEPAAQFGNRMMHACSWLSIENMDAWFALQRKVKRPEEIDAHRMACETTVEAIWYMMGHTHPGMTEGQMEAYFDFIVKYRGCGHAFPTIAAAGKNACILHYSANKDVIQDGDLVLVDLGASYKNYCADVSCTFPVNGVFTPRQKLLYQVVLDGLLTAEKAAKPGCRKDELQLLSKEVMANELMKLGVIDKTEEIERYYYHGSGHFIGLYTHDVGEDPDNILQKDMVFTLEPGLYFPKEGIGIRIEDTLLVTEDGCEVLTAGIPRTIEEIETFFLSLKRKNEMEEPPYF